MSKSHNPSLPSCPRSIGARAGAGLSLGIGLLAMGAGCGNAPQNLDHARGGAFTSLGFDEATLQQDGTPRYLGGHMAMAAPVKDSNGAAAALVGQLGNSYRLALETSFTTINQQQDGEGRNFYRLQQWHGGLRVVGRQVAMQVDKDGAIEAVLGQLAPALASSLTADKAKLGGAEAIRTGLGTLTAYPSRVLSTPELVIYMDGSAPRLAYSARVEYTGQSGYTVEDLFVSAEDGSAIGKSPRIYKAGLSRTIYDLGKQCITDGSNLPGTLALNEGGTTTNLPAQRAYDNSGNVYWFYKHMFNRDSYDGMGAPIVSTVMVTFDTGLGGGSCDGGNAAWISDPFNQMVYGNGSLFGLLLKEMTLGFDVAAHEMTHAVTYSTSNLDYQDESGALNEANSDIMGAAIEAWVDSGGGAAGNPASIVTSDDTWKIGEDVAGKLLPGGVIRLMKDPTTDMVSKDYYGDKYTGTDDNGGVHMNSGIANLAFYLLAAGGSHPHAKTQSVVTGVGIEKAARIIHTANTTLYTSTTDFEGARYATAKAAENLYGRCGQEWANVHRAWDAVGVPGVWSPCVQAPSGF